MAAARAPRGATSDTLSDLAADATAPDPAAVSDMDAAPAALAEPDTGKSDNVSDLSAPDAPPGSRVCRVPVEHDGRLYAAGDPIPLTPEQAAPLAAAGALEPEG